MGIYSAEDIVNKEDYANNESVITVQDQAQINKYKDTNTLSASDKANVVVLLQQIIVIAQGNLSDLDKMSANVDISKNLLNEEIAALKNNTVLKDLSKYDIPGEIYSITAEQFNASYERIQELKYRVNILSYKTVFLKQQKDSLNQDIETLNKYIIMLQTL